MLAAILALALTVDPAVPAAEMSRPLYDSQSLGTVVPGAEGFDVYWFRANELRAPTIPRLFRTPLDLDGRIAGPTIVVAAPAEVQLSSGPAQPLVYWSTEDLTLYAAPLSAGFARSGNGALVATRVQYASIHCEESLCFARWMTRQNRAQGAFLDLSGNLVSGPFPLPGNHYGLLPISLEVEGAALVADSAYQLSVVRIARDGTIRAEVPFLDRTLYPTAAVSHDGERVIVASIPKPWPDMPPSLAVNAIAVSTDGQVENLGAVFAPERAIHLTGLAMGWNGTSHLLVGGYVNDSAYETRLFAVELDRELRVVAAADIPTEFPYGAQFEVFPNGERFAIGWSGRKPMVAVYHAGTLSAPVTPEAPPRRRVVRR